MLLNRLIDTYKRETVLVATSAGSDSMALLSLLYESNMAIVACYVNHQQRPNENLQEIAHLTAFCHARSIPFVVKDIVLTGRITKNDQAFYREERYRLLKTCAIEYNARVIATGHHKNDQVETQFMHLVKGYGLASLAGVTEELPLENLVIIRPLLHVTKQEINQYLDAHDISYCEDSSNAKDTYLRNTLRNTIFPQIEQAHPGGVAQIGEQLDDMYTLYTYSIEQALTNPIFQSRQKIELAAFIHFLEGKPEVLQIILIRELLQNVYAYTTMVSKKLCILIIRCILDQSLQRIAISRGTHLVKTERYVVLLTVQEQQDTKSSHELYIGLQEKYGLALSIEAGLRAREAGELLVSLPHDIWKMGLELTYVEATDYIAIKTGHKKMNRVYVDAKVPRELRARLLVLKVKGSSEVLYDFTTKRLSYALVPMQKNEEYRKYYLYWKNIE